MADPRKNAYGLPILNASVAAVNEISGVGEVVRWIGGERSSLYETINNGFWSSCVGGGGVWFVAADFFCSLHSVRIFLD